MAGMRKGEVEYLRNLLNEAHTVKAFLDADRKELANLEKELSNLEKIIPDKKIINGYKARMNELFALIVKHQGWLGDHEKEIKRAIHVLCVA